MKRFEIYMADLSPIIGSETNEVKPVMIAQRVVPDDMESIIIFPITDEDKNSYGLCKVKTKNGKFVNVLYAQTRIINKKRIKEKIDEVSEDYYENLKMKIVEIMN